MFNVFLPRDIRSGKVRGFGFVRFKTEWDSNLAIQNLNGRVVGGRRITVQKAKFVDRKSNPIGKIYINAGKMNVIPSAHT